MVDNIAAKYEHRAQSAAAIRNILAVVDAQQLLGEEEEAALAAFLEVRLCALVKRCRLKHDERYADSVSRRESERALAVCDEFRELSSTRSSTITFTIHVT